MLLIGRVLAAASIFGAAVVPLTASADETLQFTYDELGRLVAVTPVGGPNDGKVTSTSYDPAGNRKGYAQGLPLPAETNAASFSVAGPPGLVAEGSVAVFVVTKGGMASGNLTVNYATVAGTASAPSDFASTTGTLSFKSWETQRTVSVPVVADGLAEPQETFRLRLSGASAGATITQPNGTATIDVSSAANQAPTPVGDNASVKVCEMVQKNVTANDTDPEGNYPLSLVSVSVTGASLGDAAIVNTSDIAFTANGATGTTAVTYVVKDSLGATASSTLAVTVQSGTGCQ